MTKLINRLIALVLLIVSVTMILVSCVTEEKEKEYYAVKTLFSYNELNSALDIIRTYQSVKPTYTVDYLGDDVTVLYHFTTGHRWTEYPVDFETFFTTKTSGFFTTFIVFNDKPCNTHHYGENEHGTSSLKVYRGDEDYDKLMNLKQLQGAKIRTSKAIEIQDRSLINYRCVEYDDDYNYHCVYYVYYDKTRIISIESCSALDENFLSAIFDHLILVK